MRTVLQFLKTIPLTFRILFFITCGISLLFIIIGVLHSIVFTYDQARDALQAYSIWHDHDIKLLGPETDIPGVFHGVVWYYILAILYAVGRIPEFVAIVFCILTICTVGLVGVITQKLFKNQLVTTVAMMLYMVSPLFQTSSRWISNPLVSLLVTPLLLILLWGFMNKKNSWIALGIGICFGLLIQSEFAFVLFLVTIPLYWIVFRFKFSFPDFVSFVIGLSLTLSSFIIAEAKFRGQGIKGMIQFFHDGSSTHNLVDTSIFFLKRIIDFFAISFFSQPLLLMTIGILIAIVCMYIQVQTKQRRPIVFLLIWLGMLVLFLVFHTGISRSYFLFFPFFAPLVILISLVIVTFFKNQLIIFGIISIFILEAALQSYAYITTTTSPLPAQQGATLQLAKAIILYTYAASSGAPFTIVTITNPLFINSTWAYLYTTYKPTKQLPYFAGRSQKDALGYLPEKQFATVDRYLIIEPTIGIPDIYVTKIMYEEDKISDVVDEKHFGTYIVQKRKLHLGKPVPKIPNNI